MKRRERPSPARPGLSARLLARYLTLDRRSLALARVMLGVLLLLDLAHRAGGWFAFYADDGLFPRADAAASGLPPSIFLWFGSHEALAGLFVALALVYACVALGLFTRPALLAAFVGWTSLAARLPLAMNAGGAVIAHLLLWLAILPSGDRFSLDALRASLARGADASAKQLNRRRWLEPEAPVVTVGALGILLQLGAIYYINGVAKTGEAWRDFTAVHYVLYDPQFATPFAVLVRDHLPAWLVRAAAGAVLVAETGVPAVLLVPFLNSRRVAAVVVIAMHTTFGLFMMLGPFAWACCTFAVLLFDASDWQVVGATMRREHRARVVAFDGHDGDTLLAARIVARLDRFGLLEFEAAPPGAALEVRDAQGGRWTGRAAAAQIAAALPLGPLFAWLVAAPFGGIGAAVLRVAARALAYRLPRRERVSRTPVRFVPAREAVAFLVIALGVSGVLSQVRLLKRRYDLRQPDAVAKLARTFDLLQGWELFAPEPARETRLTIVDAMTADGRHIDPFTGNPPRSRLEGSLGAEGLSHHWIEILRRQDRVPAYHVPLLRYAMAYGERTGRPEDRIVSAELLVLHQPVPPFGSSTAGEPSITPLAVRLPKAAQD